jgi:hypothetical protein
VKITRPYLVVAALVLAAGIAAIGLHRESTASQPPSPAAAARTSFPGLEPAGAEPDLPALATMHPAVGQIVQAPGPFDDRFILSDLRLDSAALHGVATVTSDVSDVLEFEALAGFYDEHGVLLGTGRFIYHLDESVPSAESHTGPPSELQAFSIAVPSELQGRALSAAIGVPVLVNE